MTETGECYRLDDIEGPPDGMATFQTEDNTFFLLKTGALWKLEYVKDWPTEHLKASYVTILWDFDRPLYSAFIKRGVLWLGSKKSDNIPEKWSISVKGVFSEVVNIWTEKGLGLSLSLPKYTVDSLKQIK